MLPPPAAPSEERAVACGRCILLSGSLHAALVVLAVAGSWLHARHRSRSRHSDRVSPERRRHGMSLARIRSLPLAVFVRVLAAILMFGPVLGPPSAVPTVMEAGLYGPADICTARRHAPATPSNGRDAHACCWWVCAGGGSALPAAAGVTVPMPLFLGTASAGRRASPRTPRRGRTSHRPRAPPTVSRAD